MRLSCDRKKLEQLTISDLKSAIIKRRLAIRVHGAQRMDDRCFLDDLLLWEFLDDTKTPSVDVLKFVGMLKCQEFFKNRRADQADPENLYFNQDWTQWDSDVIHIRFLDDGKLVDELLRIQLTFKAQRNIAKIRPRTADDDRVLYALLPEKPNIDMRLPSEEEFLGEAKAPFAGCPSFWRSHQNCDPKVCNLHQWGPCK